jgi:hypothetical protein
MKDPVDGSDASTHDPEPMTDDSEPMTHEGIARWLPESSVLGNGSLVLGHEFPIILVKQ